MRRDSAGRPRARVAWVVAAIGLAAILFSLETGARGTAPGGLTEGPVEHIRGIYLQQRIEIATVGTRTVHLTRMTRFRRCGHLRGIAEDFNDHLVDVTGREVTDIGFVAGIVNAIEGCSSAVPRGHGMEE